MLHLTNGDCAVPALRAAGVEGDILPWSEVLHDGPVPGGLDHAELRRVRADFLGGDQKLRERDERLDAAIRAGEPLRSGHSSAMSRHSRRSIGCRGSLTSPSRARLR